MNQSAKNRAVILMHCPNHRDVLLAVVNFIKDNKGNIINLDQHVDADDNRFFMRIEWELDDFLIPPIKISDFFDTLIARKFQCVWKLAFPSVRMRVALFASGYSHCLHDMLSRYESHEWKIDIPIVISNHEKHREHVERFNIAYHYIEITKENKAEQEELQLSLLKENKIDLIVMARYMQVLSDDFISHYPNKIINIHHSSLPAFPGADPYGSAHRRGVKIMGATAHYATSDLDEGPIIAQDVISISHRDTKANMKRKGKNIEKIVLADAVWSHINNRILAYKNRTVVF